MIVEQLRRLFDLHVRRWKRQTELAARARVREERAMTLHEYEVVGGRLDGETVTCYGIGLSPKYCYAGIYHLQSDGRLHYREPRRPSLLDLE